MQVGEQLDAAALHVLVYLIGIGGGQAARLRGIGEDPGAFQAEFMEELAQRLEILLGLAGEAGDEAGPQDQAGDPLAQLAEEVAGLLSAAPAVHGLEHMVADVLDGNVQIFDDLRLVGDHVNELVADLIGVEIVQPDPMHALDGTELGQEPGQGYCARKGPGRSG